MAAELTPDEATKLKAKIDEVRAYVQRLEERAEQRGMEYDPRSTENFRAHLHNVGSALHSLWVFLHSRSCGQVNNPHAGLASPSPTSEDPSRRSRFSRTRSSRPAGPPRVRTYAVAIQQFRPSGAAPGPQVLEPAERMRPLGFQPSNAGGGSLSDPCPWYPPHWFCSCLDKVELELVAAEPVVQRRAASRPTPR
jgi:hypothetical protein